MIIANPLYDAAFKRIMENNKLAKFFVSTIINEEIESLEILPQEYSYITELDPQDPQTKQYIDTLLQERLWINLYRLDYVAILHTKENTKKKVLIEVQKAMDLGDVMRFRNYLAGHYKRQNIINDDEKPLEILAIYILGNNLPDLKNACIKVGKNYRDILKGTHIEGKDTFIELLTHEAYFIQTKRIQPKYQNKLDQLLSIFEQTNFITAKEIIKNYNHQITEPEVLEILKILEGIAASPERQKELEKEQEAHRIFNLWFGEQGKALVNARKELQEKEQTIQDKDSELKNKDSELKNKDSELKNKDSELKNKDSELKNKDSELKNKDSELKNKDSELKNKDSELKNKDSELKNKDQALQEKENSIRAAILKLIELNLTDEDIAQILQINIHYIKKIKNS